ncbi:MAG TPA: acetylxylan esterase [Ktedonobacteraceae bacterium]|nr:acetylxylan esterase [Ktedonobacteraceae bacterium]
MTRSSPLITCRVLFSIGLLDTLCPPSTGFAVYNHLTCEKKLKIYPYNGHEGGGLIQNEEKYRFVRRLMDNGQTITQHINNH